MHIDSYVIFFPNIKVYLSTPFSMNFRGAVVYTPAGQVEDATRARWAAAPPSLQILSLSAHKLYHLSCQKMHPYKNNQFSLLQKLKMANKSWLGDLPGGQLSQRARHLSLLVPVQHPRPGPAYWPPPFPRSPRGQNRPCSFLFQPLVNCFASFSLFSFVCSCLFVLLLGLWARVPGRMNY